jgi:ribosomal protein S6--L-glutamate ligase
MIVVKLASQDDPGRLRLHMLRELERRGVRVFSPADVIEKVMDRYALNMALARAGFPLPHTVSFEVLFGLASSGLALGRSVVKPVYTSREGACSWPSPAPARRELGR